MKADYPVVVLDAARLKSELAMYIWTQTEDRRTRKGAAGEPPKEDPNFGEGKKLLSAEVLKLAGKTFSLSALTASLKVIIDKSKSETVNALSPDQMASKISTRPK